MVATNRYEEIGADIGKLVTEKQIAYGDSFGKSGGLMRILYPTGISAEKLDDALTIVRVLDKLMRIATDKDALGESPWRDIAGYALLSVARDETKTAGKTDRKTKAYPPDIDVNLPNTDWCLNEDRTSACRQYLGQKLRIAKAEALGWLGPGSFYFHPNVNESMRAADLYAEKRKRYAEEQTVGKMP